jgi:hypothetical protein
VGLGRAKTRARCSAVEWRSKTPNVLAFSREAHVTMPTDAPRQKSRKPRGSYTSGARLRSCLSGTMCRGGAVPAACGNKILTILAPYTFSHNQGQEFACRRRCPHGRSPSESRPNRCSAANGESVPRQDSCSAAKPLGGVHHSITSSARARSVGGIVRASALAVLRLIISSNLVGCAIGRLLGLSPLRILST